MAGVLLIAWQRELQDEHPVAAYSAPDQATPTEDDMTVHTAVAVVAEEQRAALVISPSPRPSALAILHSASSFARIHDPNSRDISGFASVQPVFLSRFFWTETDASNVTVLAFQHTQLAGASIHERTMPGTSAQYPDSIDEHNCGYTTKQGG